MLNKKTKIVALVYISNVLGGIAPVQQISEAAHKVMSPLRLAEIFILQQIIP